MVSRVSLSSSSHGRPLLTPPGLQCRTGEVFEALGVQDKFARETHECAEVIIWEHDNAVGGIKETGRVVDVSNSRRRRRGEERRWGWDES
jgi:hypothetical protein